MPRKTTNIRRGKGAVPGKTVQDNSFANPTRDTEPLRVHVHDPSRAHMASSIGIVDASSCFISDEVEGALQELCAVAGSGFSAGRLNGLIELGTYTGTYPNITIDTTSLAHIRGGSVDISGKTYDFSTGLDPVGGAPTSTPGTYYLYIETDVASADYQNLLASTTLPDVSAEKVLIARITHDGASYTAETDARFFVRDLDRKISYTSRQGENLDAWSEGCFANLEAAFLWLEVYRDRGAGVTDEYKSTLIVRGEHVLSSMITANIQEGIRIIGENESSITTSAGGYTDPYLLNIQTVSSGTVLIENLKFRNDGNAASLTHCVNLSTNLDYLYFSNCRMSQNTQNVCLFNWVGGSRAYIEECRIINGRLTDSGTSSIPSLYKIDGCAFSGNTSLIETNTILDVVISNSYIANYEKVFDITGGFTAEIQVTQSELKNVDSFSSGSVNLWMDNCEVTMANNTQNDFFGSGSNDIYFLRLANTSFTGANSAVSRQFCNVQVSSDVVISGCTFNGFENFQFDGGGTKVSINNCNFNTANITIGDCLSVNIHDNNILWDEVGASTPRISTSGTIENFVLSGNTLVQNESSILANIAHSGEKVISENNFVGGSTTQVNFNNSQIINNKISSSDVNGTTRSTQALLTDVSLGFVSAVISGNIFEEGFGGIAFGDGSNITITNNQFRDIANNNAGTWVGAIQGVNAGIGTLTNALISGNVVSDCGTSRVTGATDSELAGIYLNFGGGIFNTVISDNIIKGLEVDTSSSRCIFLDGNCKEVSIENNNLTPFTAASLLDTSGVYGDLGGTSSNLKICGNTIGANPSTQEYTHGVYLNLESNAGITSFDISNNSIKDYFQNGIWLDYGSTANITISSLISICGNTLKGSATTTSRQNPGNIRISGSCDNQLSLSRTQIKENAIHGPNNGIVVDMDQPLNNQISILDNLVISGNFFKSTGNNDWTSPEDLGGILVKQTSLSATTSDGFCTGLTISNNQIDFNNSDFGIRVYQDGYSNWQNENWDVSHNKVLNAGNYGIHIRVDTPGASGASTPIEKISLIGNTLDVNGDGGTAGSSVLRNYGIHFELNQVSVSDALVSNNRINCSSNSNTINGSPLVVYYPTGALGFFQQVQVSGNYFSGESGNATTEYSSCKLQFEGSVVLQDFSFLNNTCILERALSIENVGRNTYDVKNIVVSDNSSEGRHAFVFASNNSSFDQKMQNLKVEGNTHKHNAAVAEINSDLESAIHVYHNGTRELSLSNCSIQNNTVFARDSFTTGDPAFGGIFVWEMDNLYNVKVDGNIVQNITAPAVLVSCSKDLVQNVSISNNQVSFGLLETWNANREDAVIDFEYADPESTSSIGTRDWSGSISIDNNNIYQLELSSTNNSCIWVSKNPDITYGVNKPAGITAVSVDSNKITNIIGRYGVQLDFTDVNWLLKSISCSNNTFAAEGRFPDSDPFGYNLVRTGLFLNGPSGVVEDLELEGIRINNNLVHNHATDEDYGILAKFYNDSNDAETYQLVGFSMDNNTLVTAVDSTKARGLDLELTCAARDVSVSGNNVAAKVYSPTPEYPSSGIRVFHDFQNHGVQIYQKNSADDGNDFNLGASDQVKIAGTTGSGELRVYNTSTTTIAVQATKWENISIDNNKVNYNSRYTQSTATQQYPLVFNADLIFTAVSFNGLTTTGNRQLVVVPTYGLSISNNTLRGFWKSSESQEFAGMLVHTCPVYGKWSNSDTNDADPAVGGASLKFVAQGWMIQGNNASGYCVHDLSGTPTYYGYDQFHLVSPFDSTNIKHEDWAGLTFGNVGYSEGVSVAASYGNITTDWVPLGDPVLSLNNNYNFSNATKTIN